MLDGKGGTSAGIYVGGSDLFPKIETYIIFCDTGFRPGSRDPFVSAKGPKTIDAPSGLIKLGGRKPGEGGPTRCAQTRPTDLLERPPMGPGGRRPPGARGR